MSMYDPQLSQAPGSELPLPPAVTQRYGAQAATDDVVLMPPFSRATMHPPLPLNQTVESPVPETHPWVAAPAPAPLQPLAGVPDAALPATIEPAQPPLAPDPERELAEELADRLEEIAAQLRRLGFRALLKPRSEQEPIDVVLASVIAGFLARR